MKKLHIFFVYSILILFSLLALNGWYNTYKEFLSEQAIANGIVSILFTVISVTGWILRKEIIKEIIKWKYSLNQK